MTENEQIKDEEKEEGEEDESRKTRTLPKPSPAPSVPYRRREEWRPPRFEERAPPYLRRTSRSPDFRRPREIRGRSRSPIWRGRSRSPDMRRRRSWSRSPPRLPRPRRDRSMSRSRSRSPSPYRRGAPRLYRYPPSYRERSRERLRSPRRRSRSPIYRRRSPSPRFRRFDDRDRPRSLSRSPSPSPSRVSKASRASRPHSPRGRSPESHKAPSIAGSVSGKRSPRRPRSPLPYSRASSPPRDPMEVDPVVPTGPRNRFPVLPHHSIPQSTRIGLPRTVKPTVPTAPATPTAPVVPASEVKTDKTEKKEKTPIEESKRKFEKVGMFKPIEKPEPVVEELSIPTGPKGWKPINPPRPPLTPRSSTTPNDPLPLSEPAPVKVMEEPKSTELEKNALEGMKWMAKQNWYSRPAPVASEATSELSRLAHHRLTVLNQKQIENEIYYFSVAYSLSNQLLERECAKERVAASTVP